MKHLVAVLSAAMLASAPRVTVAAAVQAGETVLLSQSHDDDVYLAGGKVMVEGEVAGDVSVAGGSIVINEPVMEDLHVAGGSIVINGTVGDDLRAAGGDITLSRDVGDDLLAFGGRITITPRALVSGDANAAGAQVLASGTVEGNAKFGGRQVVFDGIVRGDGDFFATEHLQFNGTVEGKARLSAPQITLGPGAVLGAGVQYWRQEGEMQFGEVLRAGQAVYSEELGFMRNINLPTDVRQRAAAGLFGAWMLFTVLSGALLLLLLCLFMRGYFSMASETLQGAFWRSFGLGVLYFILMPVAAALLMATVIGVPLGLLLVALYVFSLLFAKVFTSLVLALWLESGRDAMWSRATLFFAAFGLFLLLKLAMLVPFLGWLTVAFLVCAAFGAMMTADVRIFRRFA